jgi:hypothetical protein
VQRWWDGQAENNSFCPIRRKDAGADTGLVRDLRVYRLKKCMTGTTKGEEDRKRTERERK